MLASLYQLLNHQVPDQIIWTADITYWIAGQPKALVHQKGWDQEEGYLKLCLELGIMPYYWYDRFWTGRLVSERVSVETWQDGNLIRKVWKTPRGYLIQESSFMQSSHSEAITRYPVQDVDDLRLLLYILEHSQGVPANLEDYPQRMREWAVYDGLPSLALPRSALPALFTEWTGVEKGVYFLLDEPGLVNAILDQFERLEAPVLDAVCALAPPLIHFADNLTSEVYTPFFDRYMSERYARRIKRLHVAGVRCAVHLDGTVRGLLPKLVSAGIDAIEALTPQPVGDVPVEKMRNLAGSTEVILWGGVPGAMFSAPFTWEDVQRHVHRVLDCWRGTRFILGTADQVPPDGDIAMVKRIAELITHDLS